MNEQSLTDLLCACVRLAPTQVGSSRHDADGSLIFITLWAAGSRPDVAPIVVGVQQYPTGPVVALKLFGSPVWRAESFLTELEARDLLNRYRKRVQYQAPWYPTAPGTPVTTYAARDLALQWQHLDDGGWFRGRAEDLKLRIEETSDPLTPTGTHRRPVGTRYLTVRGPGRSQQGRAATFCGERPRCLLHFEAGTDFLWCLMVTLDGEGKIRAGWFEGSAT